MNDGPAWGLNDDLSVVTMQMLNNWAYCLATNFLEAQIGNNDFFYLTSNANIAHLGLKQVLSAKSAFLQKEATWNFCAN